MLYFHFEKIANFQDAENKRVNAFTRLRGLYFFQHGCLAIPSKWLVGSRFHCTDQLMSEEIHIGKLIRDKLKEDGHSVSWFARKMSCDRTNIYKIFRKQHIDNELLMRISFTLNYNFFSKYSFSLYIIITNYNFSQWKI